MKTGTLTAALAAAVITLTAPALRAEVSTQSIIDNLTAAGFQNIEITTGPTQVRAEATNGTDKIEVVYDRTTGQILNQETSRERVRAEVQARVEVRTSNEDFDDDSEDDSSLGDDSEDDDHDSADHGSDDSGDDSGDDHDGSDHDGSDHDSSDGADD